MSQDVCSSGASIGVQTFGVGVSGGKHFRDFTYIDDVVKIIYLLSKKIRGNKIYNICASKPLQINKLLETQCEPRGGLGNPSIIITPHFEEPPKTV